LILDIVPDTQVFSWDLLYYKKWVTKEQICQKWAYFQILNIFSPLSSKKGVKDTASQG
jgi:hypothetical protein